MYNRLKETAGSLTVICLMLVILLTIGCKDKPIPKTPLENAEFNLRLEGVRTAADGEKWDGFKCSPRADDNSTAFCTVLIISGNGKLTGMRKTRFLCSTSPDSWCNKI